MTVKKRVARPILAGIEDLDGGTRSETLIQRNRKTGGGGGSGYPSPNTTPLLKQGGLRLNRRQKEQVVAPNRRITDPDGQNVGTTGQDFKQVFDTRERKTNIPESDLINAHTLAESAGILPRGNGPSTNKQGSAGRDPDRPSRTFNLSKRTKKGGEPTGKNQNPQSAIEQRTPAPYIGPKFDTDHDYKSAVEDKRRILASDDSAARTRIMANLVALGYTEVEIANISVPKNKDYEPRIGNKVSWEQNQRQRDQQVIPDNHHDKSDMSENMPVPQTQIRAVKKYRNQLLREQERD